jgi:tryptophanyl-tRNA synthetase
MVADVEAAALGQPVEAATVQPTVRRLIAAGIDPTRCSLFVQSQLSEHLSAAYLPGTLYTTAELIESGYFRMLRSRGATHRLTAAPITGPTLATVVRGLRGELLRSSCCFARTTCCCGFSCSQRPPTC